MRILLLWTMIDPPLAHFGYFMFFTGMGPFFFVGKGLCDFECQFEYSIASSVRSGCRDAERMKPERVISNGTHMSHPRASS